MPVIPEDFFNARQRKDLPLRDLHPPFSITMYFDELDLGDDLLDALYEMHFDECTPIQAMAIPPALEGHDLMAIAQTGTGKTAAYLLPVIERLTSGNFPTDAINCVIMTPTRELAQQIDRQMEGFSYYLPVSSLPIFGGTDGRGFSQQQHGLIAGADVVIATPGRLLAHLQTGRCDLSRVAFFILDEADRMLDMGFYDDIMAIASHLPKERQTLMFSATMPAKIKQLAASLLSSPVEVKTAVSKPAEGIDQSIFAVPEPQKEKVLIHLFRQGFSQRVIIFAASKLKVKDLARNLRRAGWQAAEMHSDLDQRQREDVMLDFRAGRQDILVATDIVARGIDIDDIAMVVNYDVPREAEDYVHRIGRTARAGAGGKAVTLVNERDRAAFSRIEHFLRTKIRREPWEVSIDEKTPSAKKSAGSSSRKRRGDKQCKASAHKDAKPAGNEEARPAKASGPRRSFKRRPKPKPAAE